MAELVQRIAVKALIVDDSNRVLLLRKSEDNERHAGKSGRYNLPGGKINPGESIEEALKREVLEEVNIVIDDRVQEPLFVGEWRPTVKNIPHQIIGVFFVCPRWRGKITLDSEHDKYAWVDPQSIGDYDILPPEDQAIAEYFSR